VTVAAGYYHSLAIRSDGTLWLGAITIMASWACGTLYRGTARPGGQRHQLDGGGRRRVYLSGVRSDGTLWAWGDNFRGQLGLETATIDGSHPGRALGHSDMGGGVCRLVALSGLRSDGTLWSWGYNYYGQLGWVTLATPRD